MHYVSMFINCLCFKFVWGMWVCIYIVGLWWPFLCAMCYCCLCFISLSRFVMPLLPTTDSRLFLPRSWLAFVCKIDEWMNYVSMFIFCLCFISLCRLVMALVFCVLLLSVLFLLVGLWWSFFQQQIRAFLFRVRDSRLCVRLMSECIMWVYLWIVCVLFIFTGMWVYLWSVCVLIFFEVCEYVYEVFVFYLFSSYVSMFMKCLCFIYFRGMWVYLWIVCVLFLFTGMWVYLWSVWFFFIFEVY